MFTQSFDKTAALGGLINKAISAGKGMLGKGKGFVKNFTSPKAGASPALAARQTRYKGHMMKRNLKRGAIGAAAVGGTSMALSPSDSPAQPLMR